ncbi:hypothetical protein L210DRAFT_3504554 [Boletus edulis BED1]|uniref:Uncharacterized protein n=1 Tax=Boletus edulis BED1 TaxID=1328754 RepID=A0AAD4GEM4_BOLED|nr:hypothetical protein L210DRAFT_3504554 [Boletus edulis BED1]
MCTDVYIHEYPLLAKDGQEKNICNHTGHRIPHREALLDEDTSHTGMIALSISDGWIENHGLFSGTWTYGAIQSTAQELNSTLWTQYLPDDEDEVVADLMLGYSPLVEEIGSQVKDDSMTYNWVFKRQPMLGTHHTAQAQTYHKKITGLDVDMSTCVENIFRISLWCIPEESHNGRTIFNEILVPLCEIWSHGQVLEMIKSHVIIFQLKCCYWQACKVYVCNVVALICKGAREEIKDLLDIDDVVERGVTHECQTLLNQWQSSRISQILVKVFQGLILGRSWFADQLADSTLHSGPRVQPPFWRGCKSLLVFKVVDEEAAKILGSQVDMPETTTALSEFLMKGIVSSKICNIPWSPNPTGAANNWSS